MKKIAGFIRKDAVLSIAVVLAVLSMFFVHPSREYLDYIDFRTLVMLFCLMTIVAGWKKLGIFDWLAEALLTITKSITGVVSVLVFLCFFLSMLITNDVALITFVPFTITIMHRLGERFSRKWMIRVIVMQTIAANLGSMFTPIGNPQNLYLFGKTELSTLEFLKIMFPYTVAAFVFLLIWIVVTTQREKNCEIRFAGQISDSDKKSADHGRKKNCEIAPSGQISDPDKKRVAHSREKTVTYGILLIISLLSVARVIPYPVVFVLVLAYVVCRDRMLLKEVDYSLLGTFTGLFIFIGNLGRFTVFHEFLQHMIHGREMWTAVLASQVMSNVPAAILLSGFTDQVQKLIIGTNLGGLGTLIASMASLISFKYLCRENAAWKGRYLRIFTLANLIFLFLLCVLYVLQSA